MFRILHASLALAVCLALSSSTQAATYYVSPSGSSSNTGTQASPWSLAKANTDLVAGDTAILLDGSYLTQIKPSQSGTAGSPITYRAQNSRMALLTSGNPRIEVSNRSYITIDGVKSSNGTSRWAIGNFSSHITINDCEFVGTLSSSGFERGRFQDTGGYIHITNSYFDNQADGIAIREGKGHYIANTYILRDTHSPMVVMGISDSVIENCYFDTDVHRNLEVLSTRGIMPPDERRTNYIIIQDNYFHATDQAGKSTAIKQSGSFSILRRNVFDNCSVAAIRLAQSYGSQVSYRPEGWYSEENRVYNNTFYDCPESIQVSKSNSTIAAGGAFGNNICVNNIIYGGSGEKQVNLYADTLPTDVAFYYNSIMRSTPGQDVFLVNGLKTVAEVETAYPTHYANNYEFDPMFTDAAADDFTLAPGSNCIDAGGNLTTTVGSGSGTVVVVADSLYFTDGYGLIDPDTIRVGGNRVQIVSIDRATHVITVDASISWSDGDPVYLDYFGLAPDLGAFESGSNETIEGRHVFYNNSAWDGNDTGANAADDAAIATNKSALLPGETANFANYTSYSKGINGVMVDMSGAITTPTLADFAFAVGNVSNLSGFTAAPTPTGFAVRPGAGIDGADRVTIIFADGAIVGKWLQVTHLPTSDVFYFGNAVGDTGNSLTDAEVTPTDEIYVRNNPATIAISSASITHAADFNRDKRVGPTDSIIARNNGTNSSTALDLIAPFTNKPPTVEAGSNDAGMAGTAITLAGMTSDDGYPSGTLTTTWSKVSGPGTVTFSDANALDSTATFSVAGTYVLQLLATDGEHAVTDTMEVNISAPTGSEFVDDFDDNDISDWSPLAGGMTTLTFSGTSGYEICPTVNDSRISKAVDGSGFADTVYISFTIRHTSVGAGWKHGIFWLVDSSGAGFGLFFGLEQSGNGGLEVYETTDSGATDNYVGWFNGPGPASGTAMKSVELIYDRTANTLECIYKGVSKGTVSVDPNHADFSKVVIYLKKPITDSGRINFDNLRIADTPLGG